MRKWVPGRPSIGIAVLAMFLCVLSLQLSAAVPEEDSKPVDWDALHFTGEIKPDRAKVVFEGEFNPRLLKGSDHKVIYATKSTVHAHVSREVITQSIGLFVTVLQGEIDEIVLGVTGDGTVTRVEAEGIKDWGLFYDSEGKRFLVIRLAARDMPVNELSATVVAETSLEHLPAKVSLISLAPRNASLFSTSVRLETSPETKVAIREFTGLSPMMPEVVRATSEESPVSRKDQAFLFTGAGSEYRLALSVDEADPEAKRIVFEEFHLSGNLHDGVASFELQGTVRVNPPKGGKLELLSGAVAMTDLGKTTGYTIDFVDGKYSLVFEANGEFPVRVRFDAVVTERDGWNGVEFGVANGSLKPIVLKGLAADTQLSFRNAAKPERTGDFFASFLPAAGPVSFQWQTAKPEVEGKLFYAVEGLMEMITGPGLLRQINLVSVQVMQGEMDQVVFELEGDGEITRVQGSNVLAWSVEQTAGLPQRRLVISLNQPQKADFDLQIITQSALSAFPVEIVPLRLRPLGAIRFGGYLRIANDGAVRLEVVRAQGISQISPDQFPERQSGNAQIAPSGSAAFAFRFSDSNFSFVIQADNIQPEISVSELLTYHLGETDASIEAELELEIREAPLREFSLRIPSDYSVSQLSAPSLSDYFVGEGPVQNQSVLRLVFSQPLEGRQVVQLRLEKNNVAVTDTWNLPRMEPDGVKSLRGHIAVLGDSGLRLNATVTRGVTEIAAAFFPKRIASIQSAYRLQEEAWQISLSVERVALAIQVDSFHLFSVGEGINYGSSVLNYLIAGAPVSTLRFEVSSEFSNAEFIGKDIRNWKKTAEGYEVDLQTPVSGSYTLLVNFEQAFPGQGAILSFTGIRPLDVQSERGYAAVISTYQFRVSPSAVSTDLIQLEPQEIPAEYRLLYDAPVLAAYQFTSRPFDLRLELSPRTQGDTVPQVVDRAVLHTRVSRDGEALTEARYFIKTKGHSHLRVNAPSGTRLWSAEINGNKVVPVTDGDANLIPLPQSNDPNAVIPLTLNVASKSRDARTVTIAAPIVSAPVILTEWTIEPDEVQRLEFRGGTIEPVKRAPDVSGFAWLSRVVRGGYGKREQIRIAAGTGLFLMAALLWQWIAKSETFAVNAKNITVLMVGGIACAMAFYALAGLGAHARSHSLSMQSDLSFQVPVQEGGNALSVTVKNLPVQTPILRALASAFPVIAGLALWGYVWITRAGLVRQMGVAVGWVLLFWGVLRIHNGGGLFLVGVAGFLLFQFVVPVLIFIGRLPREPSRSAVTDAGGTAPLIVFLLAALYSNAVGAPASSSGIPSVRDQPVLPGSVIQKVRVTDSFAFFSAKIQWRAETGQSLDVLSGPGVLTRIDLGDQSLKLNQTSSDGTAVYRLTAGEAGAFEASIEYQVAVVSRDGVRGFFVPTGFGLVNSLEVFVEGQPVEWVSPEAVSIVMIEPPEENGTRARIVLKPTANAWVGFRPRQRDTRKETAVFYADFTQLFIPTAGVVEGVHDVHIRPAQGEVSSLAFRVPQEFTITDVRGGSLSAWRFDPDNRRLQVHLEPPQSGAFQLRIVSQVAAGSLPYRQSAGLVSLEGAAGQIGLAGVATGPDIQINDVAANRLSAINIEDFPFSSFQGGNRDRGTLTLRRAFRYVDSEALLELSVSSVQPDIRVVSQETLSLSEDRSVLAARLAIEITRAGVFKLSFVVPEGMDVETVSGQGMSHWTQLKDGGERIVTMHLRGKTEGHQEFTVNLVGPGVAAAENWPAPRLILREASKQSGQLVVIPEQGMRVHVASRDGITPIDSQQAGIRQKGVLAFRLLHNRWSLSFAVEQVAAWIQVAMLQDVTVREGQVKVVANLQYQIENTALKSLMVQLPSDAQSVRFVGADIADFVRQEPVSGTNTVWEIKLNRRVIGKFTLQALYQLAAPDSPSGLRIHGVSARDVNLHKGYLTIRSGGRLNVSATNTPPELQRADWQTIPGGLRSGVVASEPNLAFRALQPDFGLSLGVVRHEVSRMLPARVESANLTSVISGGGMMLTEVRVDLHPGDKRLLHVKLPKDSRFWFAFANQRSIWPWREGDEILLPLEPNTMEGKPASVEFYFSSQTRGPQNGNGKHRLLGPEFDLPLENITWRVLVPEAFELKDWAGSLQFLEGSEEIRPVVFDVKSYIENEERRERQVSKEAETFLELGNQLIVKGDQEQARQAFKSAWNLSQHDQAFNEDARIQLQNLRMQQAMVGLNYWRNSIAGNQAEEAPQAAMPKLQSGRDVQYTQQEAQQILEGSSGEENAILSRLAERLINQQEAARGRADAIRASLPEQGRLLTFTRSLLVDSWAGLNIDIDIRRAAGVTMSSRVLVLAGLLAWIITMMALSRRRRQSAEFGG